MQSTALVWLCILLSNGPWGVMLVNFGSTSSGLILFFYDCRVVTGNYKVFPSWNPTGKKGEMFYCSISAEVSLPLMESSGHPEHVRWSTGKCCLPRLDLSSALSPRYMGWPGGTGCLSRGNTGRRVSECSWQKQLMAFDLVLILNPGRH